MRVENDTAQRTRPEEQFTIATRRKAVRADRAGDTDTNDFSTADRPAAGQADPGAESRRRTQHDTRRVIRSGQTDAPRPTSPLELEIQARATAGPQVLDIDVSRTLRCRRPADRWSLRCMKPPGSLPPCATGVTRSSRFQATACRRRGPSRARPADTASPRRKRGFASEVVREPGVVSGGRLGPAVRWGGGVGIPRLVVVAQLAGAGACRRP